MAKHISSTSLTLNETYSLGTLSNKRLQNVTALQHSLTIYTWTDIHNCTTCLIIFHVDYPVPTQHCTNLIVQVMPALLARSGPTSLLA